MKKCTGCQQTKELSAFSKHPTNKDGLQYRCKKCCSLASQAWHKKNPSVSKTIRMKRQFGITFEQYEEMYLSQGGLCAICNKPETATIKGTQKSLAIDHCHKTGKVRGLLCRYCNLALGYLQDNPELCDNAKRYLCKTN